MTRRFRQPFAALLVLALLLTGSLWRSPVAHADDASPAVVDSSAGARVIVKFRSGSTLLRQHILSAGDRHLARAEALGERIGRPLKGGGGVGERTQVVTASGVDATALAARLSQESDVEYAVVDERVHVLDVPNDPLYAAGVGGNGPAVGQWYLRAPDATVKASINAEPAWAATTGSPGIVVAVLDTGVRFDHADFKTVANGGNLLPGYDMVSDTYFSNDGDGRDADASDPGDWVTSAENASGSYKGCGASNSTWHGTQTAGLIGATTNNAIGMASVGRNVRVLPVRVLGKCGGLASDVIAGMYWAAGLSVDDASVPANANPAKVINLSLGGNGACSAAYADAVTAVTAAGVTVVVAAGNTNGLAVQSPANCVGAVAVAGVRHTGSKVDFSDVGPEIAISAPAGNCVNTSTALPCLYPILTTANSGTTAPVVGGSIYTDSINFSLGTSFSAPMVAGTVALMLSAQPTLKPADLLARLKSTARAFPTTGSTSGTSTPVPICVAPTSATQLQCYCTTTTCGAGLLDAGAAVLSAANVVAQASFSPATPTAGQSIVFTSTTLLASGRTVATYAWTIVNSTIAAFSGAANGPTATVVTSGSGSLTVQLVVTDSFGSTATTSQTVSVQAAPVAASTGGGGGGGAIDVGWLTGLAVAVAGLWFARRRTPG